MKVLVTGANGYIGNRLIPVLIHEGHKVVALVRNPSRLHLPEKIEKQVEIVVGDFLKPESLDCIPEDVEATYYLAHSMKQVLKNFDQMEIHCAANFLQAMEKTQCRQIIYLSGLVSQKKLSKHLASRLRVEQKLKESTIPVTVLRAGIIIGSGSASFEIIRDLVEKLPVMVAPKWVKNRCQPISIFDVLIYLKGVLGNPKCLNKTFDIGGPDILTYKQMLYELANIRSLKRWIITVPVLTPRLSSYWLYFVTSTSYYLARSLVESLKTEAICRDHTIQHIIPHECMTYKKAIQRAFDKIEQNEVASSWKDAFSESDLPPEFPEGLEVPKYGCVNAIVTIPFEKDREDVIRNVWSIGGNTGWYAYNWAWNLRGFLDQIIGGVGLRRGRRDPVNLRSGDALDFWRVVVADREAGRLILFAEMKLPGEAWLEFNINEHQLTQTATFRPKGILGRMYWYSLYPLHKLIFFRMAYNIVTTN
ncbi:MAG: SDR family oxidoreductase [Chlamydiales bacterium]